MATVTENLDDINTESEQRAAFFNALNVLQRISKVLISGNQEVQAIIDAGGFETIPDDVKTILNRWRNELKGLQTTLQADAEIIEAYQWEK